MYKVKLDGRLMGAIDHVSSVVGCGSDITSKLEMNSETKLKVFRALRFCKIQFKLKIYLFSNIFPE